MMTYEETPDPRDARIAELESRIQELETEAAQLQSKLAANRPALIRDAIRDAGYDPSTQEGKILQELAKNEDFIVNADYVALRAETLGFDPTQPTTIQPPAEPNSRQARNEARLAKTRELAAMLTAGITPTDE
jgi:hypothetical protein